MLQAFAPGGNDSMPIHDWTCVEAGIFHAFHHEWISALAAILNDGLLPEDYYALPEQHAGGFGPDVLTLQSAGNDDDPDVPVGPKRGGLLLAPPRIKPIAETDLAFYRRKQDAVAIRHVSGDRLVAMVEVVSPGNKSGRKPLRAFVEKAAQLIDEGIHLLILDLLPPGKRDPEGIHNEIWQEIEGAEYALPRETPLTVVSYEAGDCVRVYIQNVAVGDVLPDMPLFLEPRQAVEIALEATYNSAFVKVPRRWRRVLEPQ
jgi:Protein of unknown function (DUF4058)